MLPKTSALRLHIMGRRVRLSSLPSVDWDGALTRPEKRIMRTLFLLTFTALLATGLTGCNSCSSWRPGQMLFGGMNQPQVIMTDGGCSSGCCHSGGYNGGFIDGGMVGGTVTSSGCGCGN
jgi:hypothetical protein